MNPCTLYVGTEDGLRTIRITDVDTIEDLETGMKGQAIRAIAIHPDNPSIAYVGCGLRGWGLHYTNDSCKTFTSVGFEDEWVWGVIFAPDPNTIYVGTEPPMLYVSHDGCSFDALSAIETLPSRSEWTFFHEPFYAGHVHGLAIHPDRPERLFAGVEHGAFIYSYDGGNSWNEALVGYDLHRVAVAPTHPDRVFAGAGEGLFISKDAAQSWSAVEQLHGKFVHGIVFDPENPDTVYVYVDLVSSPLYRSTDRGRTWEPIAEGLPAANPADPLCVHPDDSNVLFYAGNSHNENGRLFMSTDAGDSWERLSFELPKVWRLEVAVHG
ncbi:WD40/YVTN/BNR-like repeat-containing protein [Haladaptatus halobius]|uniref:WD40/YVTN/BNR-like repeat-containing protein n=1 Tax=Haladaptatus halobius TaxID=2884875 RepID=UPI001D09AB7E|nr:hypothetical protein [Haladaptatus halobius]